MLDQIRALVALRLLLLKRTWFKNTAGIVAGTLALLTVVVLSVVAVGAAVGLGIAGYFVALHGEAIGVLALADAAIALTLVFWAVGVLTELQRSDAIDFRKMLYLPVSLRMVFVLNFAVSMVSPLLLFFGLGAFGLTVGLALAVGPRMLLALPLAAAFYFMLAAWTYHLRGLLAVLMENKRRRRLILTLIPVAFALFFQLPNLLVHTTVIGRDSAPGVSADQAVVDTFMLVNAVLPPGWLPLSLASLQDGRPGVVALCFAGMSGLGLAGLAIGFRSTHRHYVGKRRARRRTRSTEQPRAATVRARTPWTARALPFAGDDTAALVYASIVSSLRHPRVRVQLFMPLLAGVLVMLPLLLDPDMPAQVGGFFVPFLGYIVFISAAVFLFNQFGGDPEGFQALVLLPTPRYKYLLGKNLAAFPLVAVHFVLLMTFACYLARPAVSLVAVMTLQFVQAFLSLCVVGNVLSLYFPYRMRKDSMNASSTKPAVFLSAAVSLFAVPPMLAPSVVAVTADWAGREILRGGYAVLGLVLAAVFLGLTAVIYIATLPAAGRLLFARERNILNTLLKDKE
jgi:ABC-2 type transport system permease protein